jgi:hypothetical protein
VSEASWREVWPAFRVNLVEETARCLADHQSNATDGLMPGWGVLSSQERLSGAGPSQA